MDGLHPRGRPGGRRRLLAAAEPPGRDRLALRPHRDRRPRHGTDLRLPVPGRVAITGYDDIEAAALVSLAPTTVLNPAREIGWRSAGSRAHPDRLDGRGGRAGL